MEQSVIITCPVCSQKLRIPSNLGALDVTCTSCGETFSWDNNEDSLKKQESSHSKLAQSSSSFIKELAKYFMDFLETDFHRRRNPKRSVRLRNDSNLLVAINLNKYPRFNKVIWKAINQTFKKNPEITKGSFTTTIPHNLLRLIDTQVQQLSDATILRIIENVSQQIESIAVQHNRDYDRALTLIIESAEKIIKEELVLPFVQNLEMSLERLNLGDENTIFLMEEELTEVLANLLQNKVSEILNRLIAQESLNVSEEIKYVFNIDDVKNNIAEFFESFQVIDMYTEISEMERNRSILDKHEFYLYFFDISYSSVKYPVFYIPFNVYKAEDALRIEFDSQVYINKKALEFIAQEYNKEMGKKGSVKLPTGRIIYITEYGDGEFPKLVRSIISEAVDFFQLDTSLHIDDASQQSAKSLLVRLTNSCYISLFDKSDEALINDYEQILELLSSKDNPLGGAFNKIINDFIHKNPKSFNSEVEDEWDNSEINDRLVAVSPIPLNGEQRQILSAIKKKGCNYIAVEGPPGTGKSHTITAIAFNAILANQSVLVLSDKKEALDVVEEKITDTMNRVRYDKKFQNPILRLGKTGSTYSQILSKSSIDNIKASYRAVKNEYEQLEKNIEKSVNSLKEDIDAEAVAYEDIDIREVLELCRLEVGLEASAPVEIKELAEHKDSYLEVEEIRNICLSIAASLTKSDSGISELLSWFEVRPESLKTSRAFHWFVEAMTTVAGIIAEIGETFPEKSQLLKDIQRVSDEDLDGLEEFLRKCDGLRSAVFGYMFKGKQVNILNQEFKKRFPHFRVDVPHKTVGRLRSLAEVLGYANGLKGRLQAELVSRIDYLSLIQKWIANANSLKYHQRLLELQTDVKYLESTLAKYPITCRKMRFDRSAFKTYYENELTSMADEDFSHILRYLNLNQELTKDFKAIPSIHYHAQDLKLEDLTTLQMTYLMDGRLISFYENNKADAQAMRDIIRRKKKFDRRDFVKLKEAFPCILAGIRDYAEYIPLEPEIFDLVIIDEASQVSIAQAFPALLRAKKVVIFGDKKQFSNVKAAHARSDTNREYLNRLKEVFRREVSTEQTKAL